MSFGSFLLVILLIFVGVWLFRAYRRMRRVYRMLFYGEMPQESGKKRTWRTSGHENSRPRSQNKVFTAQDGEYVEFEEIKGASSEYVHASSTTFQVEEQVEDAEWEDIKS